MTEQQADVTRGCFSSYVEPLRHQRQLRRRMQKARPQTRTSMWMKRLPTRQPAAERHRGNETEFAQAEGRAPYSNRQRISRLDFDGAGQDSRGKRIERSVKQVFGNIIRNDDQLADIERAS